MVNRYFILNQLLYQNLKNEQIIEYKLDTGITDCVVKGYAINYLINLLLNFDSIKEYVDDSSKVIFIPQLKFIKNK